MAQEELHENRVLQYKESIRKASTEVDIRALKQQLIADKNDGSSVEHLLRELEEEERRQQQLAIKRGEVHLLPLSRDEAISLQLIENVIAGDMGAINQLLADPEYNPNILFRQNVLVRNPQGEVLPIETEGKAFLHVFPSVLETSPLSKSEVASIVTRLVEERSADVNLPSQEGKTALDYAVAEKTDSARGNDKMLALINALLDNKAKVSSTTVDLIKENNNIAAASSIILSKRAEQDVLVLKDLGDWFAEASELRGFLKGASSNEWVVLAPKMQVGNVSALGTLQQQPSLVQGFTK